MDVNEVRDIDFKDSRGSYRASIGSDGTMPSILVHTKTIPAGWELATLSCWDHGVSIHTHYDKKDDNGDYIDPPSREATIEIRIDNPFNEPRISLPGFPGGPEELEVYRQEVVNGIHDRWIKPEDVTKWKYTYHERLTNYNPSIDLTSPNRALLLPKGVDQIEGLIDRLVKNYTDKGAQATTWMPTADQKLAKERPCLQRLWFRLLKNKNDELVLNLNSHWRSRDLYKAWFMNAYAITDWQKNIAERVSNKMGRKVNVGSYIDISDSLHIYGSYWKEDKFKDDIEKMKTQPIEGRIWNTSHTAFQTMTEEARENLAKDPDYYARGGS